MIASVRKITGIAKFLAPILKLSKNINKSSLTINSKYLYSEKTSKETSQAESEKNKDIVNLEQIDDP